MLFYRKLKKFLNTENEIDILKRDLYSNTKFKKITKCKYLIVLNSNKKTKIININKKF
jgi:hypothetical protein